MRKLIFNWRELFGYHLVVYIPGDLRSDHKTVELKESIISFFPSWPINFIDHAKTIKIVYP